MTLTSVVGCGFAAAVTISCVRHLRANGIREDILVFKGRSCRDWAEILVGNILAIAFVSGFYPLAQLGPKWLQSVLNFSWIQLLASKGENAVGANQMVFGGATIPFFGPIFILLLILNLPRLAAAEEEEFRDGTKNWWHAVPRSLTFGLMHMIVGVPLWLGLALAIPGMWFTRQYFKGGLTRSTMAHSLYNFMIALPLFVWVTVLNFTANHAIK